MLLLVHFTGEEMRLKGITRSHMESEWQGQASQVSAQSHSMDSWGLVPSSTHPTVCLEGKPHLPSFPESHNRSGLDDQETPTFSLSASSSLFSFVRLRDQGLRQQPVLLLTPQTPGPLLHLQALSGLLA